MKKILPPILLLICIGLMVLLHYILPIQNLLQFPFNLLGIPLIIIGIGISILGSIKFEKEITTSMTFDIPRVLVINGLYRYSRNPMYLGFIFFILGIWLLMASLSSFFVVVLFFLSLDRYYIPFEEAVLRKKFGEDYLEYKKNVRRWI